MESSWLAERLRIGLRVWSIYGSGDPPHCANGRTGGRWHNVLPQSGLDFDVLQLSPNRKAVGEYRFPLQCAWPRVSPGLRRVLYRAVHYDPHSGHAERQARGRSVYSAFGRYALPDLRLAGPACLLLRPQSSGGNVRRIARRGPDVACEPRGADSTLTSNSRSAGMTCRQHQETGDFI